jgi:hypothetical protein
MYFLKNNLILLPQSFRLKELLQVLKTPLIPIPLLRLQIPMLIPRSLSLNAVVCQVDKSFPLVRLSCVVWLGRDTNKAVVVDVYTERVKAGNADVYAEVVF